MKIEISIGELVDKITILQIKEKRIQDESKLSNVTSELCFLLDSFDITTIPLRKRNGYECRRRFSNS